METEGKKKIGLTNILLVLIFIVLIGIIGYLTFTRVIEHTNKQNSEQTNQKQDNDSTKVVEKELDINSGLVQNLYKLVNVDTVHMRWKDDKGVSAEEMSYEDKFTLAIEAIKYDSISCSKISNEITKIFGTELEVYCGESALDYYYFNTETKQWTGDEGRIIYTNLYKEDDIKAAMYQIFGKNYYERKTTVEDTAYDYTYIESQKGYVRVHGQKGGTKPILTETIQSAKEINDEIIITSKGVSDKTINIKYTFKLNKEDNSYYFTKVEVSQ